MRPFPEKYKKDLAVLKKFSSPSKIQDYLDALKFNFEEQGETCRSPLEVVRKKKAHCIEGALLASAALWYHGEPPLLLDLKATKDDFDHVVALFKHNGRWGALSKTNHSVLRYRDPIYKNIRELALSYFNEYFLNSGVKTMRSYSRPFNMLRYDDNWLVEKDNLWAVTDDIDSSPHTPVIGKKTVSILRKAHPLEIRTGMFTQWTKPKKRG